MGPAPPALSSEAGAEASEGTAGTRGRERRAGAAAARAVLTPTAEPHFLCELPWAFGTV